jgi:hypothetical protein
MKRPLSKALHTILESSIDAAIGKKQRLQTDLDDHLARIEAEERFAASDLVALLRAVNTIQRQDASINADRYNLVRYSG